MGPPVLPQKRRPEVHRGPGGEGCHDLAADPGETRNLAVAAAGETATWRGRLDGARKRFGAADASASAPMDRGTAGAPRKPGLRVRTGRGGGRRRRLARSEAARGAAQRRPRGAGAHFGRASRRGPGPSREGPRRRPPQPGGAVTPGDPPVREGGPRPWPGPPRGGGARRPGVYENQRNLANALHVAGRLDEAARAWRAAIVLRPGLGTDHYALGNVLFASGAHAPVVEYTEALRLGPPSAGLHAALGVALASTGKTGKAREGARPGGP